MVSNLIECGQNVFALSVLCRRCSDHWPSFDMKIIPIDNAKERPVELHYALPQAAVALKSISVSLAPDDVRQLFVR